MRLLDLYCGAGGGAAGYHAAGFDVVGIDIAPQPHYPHPFIQGDVFDLAGFAGFDLIHASPPCQPFSVYRNSVPDMATRYPDLIEETRRILIASGIPFVIENVPGAPIHPDLILCGSMFGLDVKRHRWFELGGFSAWGPGGCNHKGWARRFKPSTGRSNLRYTIEIGAWNETPDTQRRAMGIDWPMSIRELSEAIPPAYTEWIGNQYRAVVAA